MMRKIFCILVTALLFLVSCKKDNGGNIDLYYNFLPGTTWSDSNGNTVTFTKTTITINDCSASYSVTTGSEKIATFFSIDDLKVGDKTYVSGSAYEAEKMLSLIQYGGSGVDRFIKK